VISRGRLLDLGLAAFAAAQLGASAWLIPAGDRVVLPGGDSIGGLCWFHAVTGIACPFCGMTRSFVALAHGDIPSALGFHPAGPLLFAAMVVGVVAIAIALVARARPLVERRGFLFALEAVTMLCLVVGVFQMMRS
jgi:hypothetical protein